MLRCSTKWFQVSKFSQLCQNPSTHHVYSITPKQNCPNCASNHRQISILGAYSSLWAADSSMSSEETFGSSPCCERMLHCSLTLSAVHGALWGVKQTNARARSLFCDKCCMREGLVRRIVLRHKMLMSRFDAKARRMNRLLQQSGRKVGFVAITLE